MSRAPQNITETRKIKKKKCIDDTNGGIRTKFEKCLPEPQPHKEAIDEKTSEGKRDETDDQFQSDERQVQPTACWSLSTNLHFTFVFEKNQRIKMGCSTHAPHTHYSAGETIPRQILESDNICSKLESIKGKRDDDDDKLAGSVNICSFNFLRSHRISSGTKRVDDGRIEGRATRMARAMYM